MAIIETDNKTFDNIMREGKLKIGWGVCTVFEYVTS